LNLYVKPGALETCWACTVAKTKQKNVVKFSLHKKSQVPGERVFPDMSSMRPPTELAAVPSANWRIIVDECTKFKVSHFFHRKDGKGNMQVTQGMEGISTKIVRMDSARENKLFDQRDRARIGSWDCKWSIPQGICHSIIT